MTSFGLLLRWFPMLIALSAAAADGAPSGTLPETTFDFGTVKQGAHVIHAFAVRNTGSAPLRFEGAELSVQGMTVRFQPAQVPAGGEGAINVDWSTDHVAGTVAGEIRIKWNDPKNPAAAVSLKGTVNPPIRIDPIPAVFLSTFASKQEERVLTITNNEDKPLAVDRVESSADVKAEIAAVEPGKTFRLTVRPVPGLKPGQYEDTLVVYTDNPAQAKIQLPVHLLVRTDVYAQPDALDFGTLSLAELRRPNATVQSAMPVLVKGSGKFRITRIASDSAALAISQSPSGTSDTFELSVKLQAKALQPGKLSGTIRVSTDDPRFPELRIPVSADVQP